LGFGLWEGWLVVPSFLDSHGYVFCLILG
jgi:hypothetical protein